MKISSLLTKAKLGAIALTAMLLMAVVPRATAIQFTLDPVTQTIGVGGTAVVNLNVSGLGALTLGGFNIEINYAPAIVGINLAGVSYGTGLNLGTLANSDTTGTTAAGGLINLFEVSFVDPVSLAAGQPDSFTLASLTFSGLTVGVSPLTFGLVDLSDELGNTISPTSVQATGGEIRVTGSTSSVPETVGFYPAALVLGLVLWLGARAQRKGLRLAALRVSK